MQYLIFIILAVVLIGANAVLIWFLFKKFSAVETKDDSSGMLLLQNQLNELTRTLDTKMGESSRQMNESMKHQTTESVKIIRDITERLTRLDETNKQVISFADQLQSLQDILKNPKQRGILGEYYLETLLKNVLPPEGFKMQYTFKDGEIVDAVVFIKDKIVPIDSKFSLENYNRLIEVKDQTERDRLEKVFVNDLKNRIVETAKYIRPDEGTMDFAFMFIPHEAIYYDLIINKIGAITDDTENLIQRAANKYKVIIVSPTSFLAYLQTVLQGLRALQIEESAKEIRKRVDDLRKHFGSYDSYLQKLGNSLKTTVNQYNFAYKEYGKIDKDIMRITGEDGQIEVLTLEKPALEDEEG
ncbi:MAG: DNA recombination protein RmuC [Candidatus Paceibacterota bacterium]|jgi:DNA recombination protein RmuC